MKDIKIIVATHKEYEMPKSGLYYPIQCGTALRKEIKGIYHDNDGEDNISSLNPFFCELTAQYYFYKNVSSEYVGLVHYRRYFKGKTPFFIKKKKIKILSQEEAETLIKQADVILPKKRNYVIESLYSHYCHTLFSEPLDITEEIIKEKHPEYYKEFIRLKKRKSAHIFNMFIMKRDIFDGYSKWLFDILFELNKKVDISKYDAFHARFFGRISELLLDVYINTNRVKIKEIPVCYTEKRHLIRKVFNMLFSKITGRKYKKSV